ncbi:MAG: hypothetical protein R6V04_00375 [bacterium]
MKTLKMLQSVLLIVGAVVFLLGVLTALSVFPKGVFLVTVGGLHRVADTCILFSIALGLLFVVMSKK